MNHVERFENVMAGRPVDRLPLVEYSGWWSKTLERWRQEGLPPELTDGNDIREKYFGLDPYRQSAFIARTDGCPQAESHGAPVIHGVDDYLKIKKFLYPRPSYDAAVEQRLAAWAELQRRGEVIIGMILEGFFWFPRSLLGIEPHLYAFYDQPDLMRQINADLLAYNLRVIDEHCRFCRPNYMALAEDLSYNHGPMISRELFEEFLAPCYRRLNQRLAELGIIHIIDSDGSMPELIPWIKAAGFQGITPIERRAGNDLPRIRADHPELLMIGGYDKTVMPLGVAAMEREFERLLPAMRRGRYILSVDHQTPPDVSLENYRLYLKLMRDFCRRAAG